MVAVMHLRDVPMHVRDAASAPAPSRAPLRKGKLVMGRMVIDREAELPALSSKAARRSPVDSSASIADPSLRRDRLARSRAYVDGAGA